jgi:hypothetical protein
MQPLVDARIYYPIPVTDEGLQLAGSRSYMRGHQRPLSLQFDLRNVDVGCRLGAGRDGGHVPGSSRPIPVRPITTKLPFAQGRESCDTLPDATSSSS